MEPVSYQAGRVLYGLNAACVLMTSQGLSLALGPNACRIREHSPFYKKGN